MLTSNQPSARPALRHHLGAIADQAIDQRDVGAVGLALEVVGLRNIARHEDVGFDAGRRGIGRQGAGRVAGRGNGHLLDSQFHAHRNGAGEAARFERAGGVQAFVLHPKRVGADARAQAPGANQRRPALAQRDDRLVRRRQHRSVAPHAGGAVRNVAPPPAVADGIEIVPHQERAAATAEIGDLPRVPLRRAEAAFQIRRFRHQVKSLAFGTTSPMRMNQKPKKYRGEIGQKSHYRLVTQAPVNFGQQRGSIGHGPD